MININDEAIHKCKRSTERYERMEILFCGWRIRLERNYSASPLSLSLQLENKKDVTEA